MAQWGMVQEEMRYDILAQVIDYLVAHYEERPSLEVLAARAGYEAPEDIGHFQKMFKAYVGVSPRQLVEYMHMRVARSPLERGEATLDAAYAGGFSGNGRMHDAFVRIEGVTPGEVKRRGEGLLITYGVVPSEIGAVIIGKTARGVCWLSFMVDGAADASVAELRRRWPLADLMRDDAAVAAEAAQLLAIWRGADVGTALPLDLYGTNFQLQVWQALLRIPCGGIVTYKDIAEDVCTAKASRAVGNAVGANPISVLIPCHRVIRASGVIDNYMWGSARKKVLLGVEGVL
ncbi:MAG: methylated-DNA--[protein]-cysteine S-methyltransferase [Alphaproteobacteria bacterium]